MGTFSDSARNNFDINLSFGDFRDEDDFFDVTLAADSSNGSIEGFRTHKLILSACSPVLRSLLKEQSKLNANSKMMPVMLYLRGISARGLKHVLDFVYRGSINLPQEELNDFLAVGESLQIPLMERPKPGPAKRAPASNMGEKSKRARMVLPRVLPKNDGIEQSMPESDPSTHTKEISLSEINIKPDPGTAVPNEDLYEGDLNPGPEEDLYEGDIDPDDYNQEGGGADQAPVEEPVAGPSNGAQTESPPLTVDYLMVSKVQSCNSGFICMICGNSVKRSQHMRRHMQEIHLSSGEDYNCPHCDRYFKNKQGIYHHVTRVHKDWKGLNYDNFRVKT